MIEPSDDHLLILARRGDSRAFGRLCERHRDRLWRTVASATDSAAETDDLAQEALVGARPALTDWSSRRGRRSTVRRSSAKLPFFANDSAGFGAP